jgi:RNA polymerase sigma factor (sigma-70 family)
MTVTQKAALRQLRGLVAGIEPRLLDRELLQSYLERRDEAAFAALLQRHGPMVLGVCQAVLRRSHDAEDAFQATFLVLARNAGSIRRRDSLGSWLHGVAYRVARKARAAEARRQSLETRVVARDPVVADEFSWGEVQTILHAELNALPDRFREPLVLCYLEGLRQEEAARRLGWSESTLKGRLQRGRELLRRRLDRRGLGLAALGPLELAGQALTRPLSQELTEATRRAIVAEFVEPATRAASLARGVAGPVAPSKTGLAAALVCMTVALAGGVALFPDRGAEGEPAAPAKLAAKPPETRVDLYGDPLPEGAVVRLGSVRFRHAGVAWAFAVLDGGKTVLTTGDDRRLRFWDVVTGKQARSVRLQGAPRLGPHVAFTPEGRILAAMFQGKFILWEVDSGKEIATIPQPAKQDVASLDLSPDGRTLAAWTWQTRVFLYEWKTGKERRLTLPVRKHGPDSTYHGYFSPDGKWFVAGGGVGCALCVFDLATGREVHRLDCNALTSAVSPDGKRLAVSSCRNDRGENETVVRLFDLASGKEVSRFPQGNQGSYFSLCFSPDGKALACGFSDRSCLLDLTTGRVLFRLSGRPLGLAFTPDGKTLIGATGTRLRFWDAANGKELHDRPGEFGWEPALAVSPDGRLLASADWMAREVSLWDTTTGRLLRLLPVKGEGRYIRNLAFSRDGKTLAGCQGNSGLIQYWDVSSGREQRTVQLRDSSPPASIHGYFYQFHLSADTKHLATLERIYRSSENTRVGLWDTATGAIVRQHTLPGEIRQGAWSADGESVVLPLEEGVTRMEVDGGVVVFRAAGFQKATPVVGSPDARLLAARKPGGTLGVLEALTGKEVATLPVGRANHFALAADNRTLVSTDEGFLRVWDLATGKERHRWPSPEVMTDAAGRTFVHTLTLAPDGRRAFTALADGTALVWDLTRELHSVGKLSADPAEKDLAGWWADLAGEAPRAYAAIWRLSEHPGKAVALLRQHLKPADSADFEEARSLIRDLDSDAFEVRKKASTRLEALGRAAAPALREALAKNPPLEPRKRLERLLETLPRVPPSPDLLRQLRAVQVLERIASPEARRILGELAGGFAEAPLTREARAALSVVSDR